MILYIIRHGDPVYETDSLTELGRLQAEAVGKRIYDAKVDKIFSSPMGRAMETAKPACRMLGLSKKIEHWTHEIDYKKTLTTLPNGNIKSITDIQNTYFTENGNIDIPYERAYECSGFSDSGMREAVEYIEENGKIFLETLGYREENGVYRILANNDEKIALFCHGNFARAWISILLHIPLHIMWASFGYTHTGVTAIQFVNNKNGITAPRCLCYSDISHIYSSGLDMLYNNKIKL